jgi:diacylglycerol O-acyltransferase
MVTRLSASDASFFPGELLDTDVVGSLSILRKPRSGLSYETLPQHRTAAAADSALPAEVREVTLGLARPVWIDDRDRHHTIRRSALPSPGAMRSCMN